MHRRLAPALLLFIFTALAVSQNINMNREIPTMGPSAAQRMLMSRYCRLDFEGMRLQPGGWAQFKKFSTIANNPEFTRVIIVTRFDTRVPDDPNELPSANYLMVGFYDLLEGYKATPNATDRVIFQLLGSGEDYVVTSVSPETPHVSPRSAIAWMNRRLADPLTSKAEHARLKDAIDQLSKFLPQPRPVAAKPPGS